MMIRTPMAMNSRIASDELDDILHDESVLDDVNDLMDKTKTAHDVIYDDEVDDIVNVHDDDADIDVVEDIHDLMTETVRKTTMGMADDEDVVDDVDDMMMTI